MNLSDIRPLARYILQDNLKTKVPGDIFVYTTSTVFTLSESNVTTVTTVFHNDAELDSSGTSTYDSNTNKITVVTDLTSGDTIEVQYNYYPNYSNTELDSAIRTAAIRLSIGHYYTYEIDENGEIYPEPTDAEKNLIAFLASIELEPGNSSYRLPDISVSVPGRSLPTMDLINKAIAIFKHTHGSFNLL